LEIDLFPDPTGGTYDQSVLLRLAGTDGWMNNSALQPPGFKVSCRLPCRSIRFVLMHAFGSTSGTGWNVCKVSFASNFSAKFCKPDGMQHASLLTCHGTIACGAVQCNDLLVEYM